MAIRRSASTTGYSHIAADFNNHILKHISGPQLKLYTALLSFMPNVCPTQARLASLCGIKQVTTIQETLDQLEFMCLIEKQHRPNKTCIYEMVELEGLGESTADRVQAFNSLAQKDRREVIKYWRDNHQDRDDFCKVEAAIRTARHKAMLCEQSQDGQTCTEQGDVEANTCVEQLDDLYGTGEDTCIAPVGIVEAQKKKEKQEKGAGSACSSSAGASVAADAAPDQLPAKNSSKAMNELAVAGGALRRTAQASGSQDAADQRNQNQSSSSLENQVRQSVTATTASQCSTSNLDISSTYSLPTEQSNNQLSVLPVNLPDWCRGGDLSEESSDNMVDVSKSASLLSYYNIKSDLLLGVRGSMADTGSARHMKPGWIESKGWTVAQVKNVIWRTLLRYPQFADNVSKIKGTALRIIKEDAPSDYTYSSRLALNAARDLEKSLNKYVFVGQQPVKHSVKIQLIEEYCERLAHLPDNLIADVVYLCMHMGPVSSPGEVKDGAPIGVRVKAFKDRVGSILEVNRPGQVFEHNGVQRIQPPAALGARY